MTALIRALLLAAALGLWGGVAAYAQADATAGEIDAPLVDAVANAPVFEDLDEWESLATRVEAAITANRASTQTMDGLRSDVAIWRDRFLDRQGLNAGRIKTVQAQIAALGQPPENGGGEEPGIAARRATLDDQLDKLRAPSVLANEAYARADGLIGEIDAIIRDRQADELTERVQSPLTPASWPDTWDALSKAYRATRAEITTAWSNSLRREQAISALPRVILLVVAASVLLLRGRRWVGWIEGKVTTRSRRGKGVWRFVLSLGQVVLPVLGLVLIAAALNATGLLGRRAAALVGALPAVGLMPILARWLGRLLLFPPAENTDPPLSLPHDSPDRAFTHIVLMGYVLGAAALATTIIDVNGFDAAPQAVVMFSIGLLLALLLFRIGRVMRHGIETAPDDAGPRSFRAVARGLLGRALMTLAVLAVVAGALGYVAAFELLLFPAAITLYLFALLVILQRLSVDTYTLLSGIEDGAQDALIPVLIGFALVVLSLPVMALIWGARQTDLTELWTRFQEGFTLGGARISPTDFLTFALVFVLGYTLTRLLQGALRSSILPRTRLDAGGRNAVVAGVGYVGIFLAAVIAITTAGIDLSGLAIVAGALSVGIGFGLQNIVSNFVSGIILLIERPIAEGDWIEVGGQMGYVRDISVRSTRIETFDRTDVIVPNADLVSGQVTNWTRGNSVGRVIVPVGVAYGTDTGRVAEILQEVAEAHPMVLLNPPPAVIFQGFGADSLDFEIRAILRDVNWVLNVKSEMNHAIAKRFAEEGIEIPFAQRDIWLRNPEALRGGGGVPDVGGPVTDHLTMDDMPEPERGDDGE